MSRRIRRRISSNKTETKGHLAKVLFGLLFFAASFILLWSNEGRINLADVAKKSKQVDATAIDPANEGRFVGVSGQLTTADGTFGDDAYLRAGSYIQVNRFVEMYAWVEEEESDEDGSYTTYSLEWTSNPRPAEEFDWPEGHENPSLPVTDLTITARSADIGDFRINPTQIRLPKPTFLSLSFDNVFEGPYRIDEEYIFEGNGSLEEPLLGDIRISFSVVPAGMQVTAFGQQTENSLTPYSYKEDKQLYRALAGDRSQALAKLTTEYKNLLWGFRIGGFLLMWLGLGLLVSPLTSLLRMVPALGELGRWAIRGITFIIALTLSVTTMVISAIAHNILVFMGLVVLAAGGVYWWRRRKAGA